MRDELAVGSIEKLFRIKQNHPVIQQRQEPIWRGGSLNNFSYHLFCSVR
ncbi:hypothetical protein [Nostoc sp.]